jgi:hypothetical protein
METNTPEPGTKTSNWVPSREWLVNDLYFQRAALPNSVVPFKSVRLDEHNPEELERLASRPDTTVPAPEPDGPKSGLSQYGGRTPEGRKKSLANLRRKKVEHLPALPPPVPDNVPVPMIPTEALPARRISESKKRYLRAVLSKEEFDLYLITWTEWFKDHPEYTTVEDEHDVHTICKETMMQYRYDVLSARHPSRDYSLQYNQSVRRAQQARENLAARRVDHIGGGGGHTQGKGGATTITHNTTNIAVLAGQVDEKKVLELQRKAHNLLENDLSVFDNKKTGPEDIFDAEVVRIRDDEDEEKKQ